MPSRNNEWYKGYVMTLQKKTIKEKLRLFAPCPDREYSFCCFFLSCLLCYRNFFFKLMYSFEEENIPTRSMIYFVIVNIAFVKTTSTLFSSLVPINILEAGRYLKNFIYIIFYVSTVFHELAIYRLVALAVKIFAICLV